MSARALRALTVASWSLLASGALGILANACGGQDNVYRYDEPMRIRGAQFVEGDLPGTLPPPDVAAPADDGTTGGGAPAPFDPNGPPVVTSIQVQNAVVYSGEGAKSLSGRATSNAGAVAIRLADVGTGYWVVTLGNPDPQYPGELGWGASADFNPTLAPGKHPLRVVAIGANGRAGQASDQSLCVSSPVPASPGSAFTGDISACAPNQNPPEAVMSLTWNADVDLDLHVVTPEGRDVSAKSPLVEGVDAGEQPPRNAARVERDSLAACVPDGRRREDLVFATRPGGTFGLYVNLFNPCARPSVTFTLTVYEPEGTPGVDRHLVTTFQKSGRLVAQDARAEGLGMFLVDYPF